eukprot:TRINITY_DN3065_c0_g3_i1.p1 TRINITY_DN3065_c0_g3~~TRINITY_DN3065_c0_g3_i1.p1  ORF type:complete len:141 (-),score=7.90 TRINITY_DN3065_c0_g3_i1:257-679(-)
MTRKGRKGGGRGGRRDSPLPLPFFPLLERYRKTHFFLVYGFVDSLLFFPPHSFFLFFILLIFFFLIFFFTFAAYLSVAFFPLLFFFLATINWKEGRERGGKCATKKKKRKILEGYFFFSFSFFFIWKHTVSFPYKAAKTM